MGAEDEDEDVGNGDVVGSDEEDTGQEPEEVSEEEPDDEGEESEEEGAEDLEADEEPALRTEADGKLMKAWARSGMVLLEAAPLCTKQSARSSDSRI